MRCSSATTPDAGEHEQLRGVVRPALSTTSRRCSPPCSSSRDATNLSALPTPFSFLVVALIGAGLAGWVWATLLALRAASGAPGDNCLLTGEDLQAWSRREVVSIQRNLLVARRLMLGGVVLIAAAIGVAWLTPVRSAPGSTSVIVNFGGGTVCGTLTGIGDGAVVVRHDGQYRVVPLSSVVELRSTDRCS